MYRTLGWDTGAIRIFSVSGMTLAIFLLFVKHLRFSSAKYLNCYCRVALKWALVLRLSSRCSSQFLVAVQTFLHSWSSNDSSFPACPGGDITVLHDSLRSSTAVNAWKGSRRPFCIAQGLVDCLESREQELVEHVAFVCWSSECRTRSNRLLRLPTSQWGL